jgi:hypothetical protein
MSTAGFVQIIPLFSSRFLALSPLSHVNAASYPIEPLDDVTGS